ncbi:BFD-like [2Fe-2S] binding domain-containing protein [Caloramator quimbayensis]|uniref:BFD-like [2Fe-2S] binding domain-containing protein n=1 Tax=Caloramator quimbayensis TaxID=1147123 RepID=A0A1T4WPG1_9CLOT|nr:copper chaperone Copz family protein [Caloramator quimbayensis]SKA79242.1 BFD-like [2Fe-2S] binding domain-containing protein [Caloramator quimbayensis]
MPQVCKTDCCCGEKEQFKKAEYDNKCPVCNLSGIKVRNITVKHLVKDDIAELVGDMDYYICMNEECDVVYYNLQSGLKFIKEQVKVPIWFKKDAEPKYACYCSKVTEQQVIDAVINNGARTVKDIIEITGAMRNSDCIKNNPLGTCCHKIIQEAIEKGLSMK